MGLERITYHLWDQGIESVSQDIFDIADLLKEHDERLGVYWDEELRLCFIGYEMADGYVARIIMCTDEKGNYRAPNNQDYMNIRYGDLFNNGIDYNQYKKNQEATRAKRKKDWDNLQKELAEEAVDRLRYDLGVKQHHSMHVSKNENPGKVK